MKSFIALLAVIFMMAPILQSNATIPIDNKIECSLDFYTPCNQAADAAMVSHNHAFIEMYVVDIDSGQVDSRNSFYAVLFGTDPLPDIETGNLVVSSCFRPFSEKTFATLQVNDMVTVTHYRTSYPGTVLSAKHLATGHKFKISYNSTTLILKVPIDDGNETSYEVGKFTVSTT